MKLLIVYHSGSVDGAKAIFREYVRQGVDLTVVAPFKACFGPDCFEYKAEDGKNGYRLIPINLRKFKSYGEGFKFFELFKAVKKTNPDVIHVIEEYTGFYVAQTVLCRNILYGKRVPVFTYAAQNIPFKQPSFVFTLSLRFFKRIAYKILYPLMFSYHKRNISGVTGVNNEALLNITATGFKGPTKLIFWGINFNMFYPKDKILCRRKLGIDENTKLIGYVGRISEEKGLDDLVKAVSKNNSYNLILVGGGDYKDTLVKIIDSLGMKNRVYFCGNITYSDLVDYYNCFDIFVLPTKITPVCREQYGRVLVEAMACKLPIIGSTSGAIANVLSGYPAHLVFEQGNADDLVGKIREIEKMHFPDNFDLQKFLYKFSVKNFVLEHMKLFSKLVKNG